MMRVDIKKSILIFLVLIFCGQALMGFSCIEVQAFESKYSDFQVTEDNYNEVMRKTVEPFISSKLECGYIKSKNDISLYYEKYITENAKANIVISHGFSENLEKYHEMIYYFLKDGFNVFAIEHRGHGRSGNLGIEDKSQMNVESFDYYIDDVKTFMDKIVVPSSEDKKLFLFAHSMGGAIGTCFLEEYPEYFEAAVLSAPMLKINTGKMMPESVAKFISNIAVFMDMGSKYVIGQSPYSVCTMEDANTTTSQSRYSYYRDYISSNERFQKGGASFQWLNQSIKKTQKIRSKEYAEKVNIPVLLFQATDDSYVDISGQDEFAKNNKNCVIEVVENSKHEIFFEKDEIQKPYLEKVFKFYNDNL